MLKHKAFNRSLLSVAVATAMCSVTGYALAQEVPADEALLEEIEVVGIRRSLQKSADVKRDGMGVSDVITAEDMGKFPDSNLAESLQRVPGVSINRENGEGQQVTVRGLGPRFNLVQLNNRQMAAASGQRSFDFSAIAPDMIRGIEVHKTTAASRETGGMGATINVRTMRPLEEPGERAVVSAQGIYDQSSHDPSVTPEFSGIYSNTFDDDKFGVAVAVNYQERANGRNQARGLSYQVDEWGQPGTNWQPQELSVSWGSHANGPEAGDRFTLPRMDFYNIVEQEHTRANAQAVFQWRPVDNITATVDYNYFNKDIDTVTNSASIWYNWDWNPANTAVWSDDPIKSPLVYAELSNNRPLGETTFAVREDHVRNTLQSYGLNLEWEATDDLSFELDLNGSTNEVTPNGGRLGSTADVEMAALTRSAVAYDRTGDIPAIYVTNPNVVAADVVPLTHRITSQFNEGEVSQAKFSGEWRFTDEQSLNFGLQSTNLDWSSGNIRVERGRGHYEQFKGDFVSFDGFSSFNFMNEFDASYGDFDTIAAQLPAGNGTITHPWTGESATLTGDNFYSTALNFDLNQMLDYLAANYGGYVDGKDSPQTILGNCNSVFCASNKYNYADLQNVSEETKVAYLQYNLNSNLFGLDYALHLGYRYEQTDITAASAITQYDTVLWVKSNQLEFRPAVDQNGEQVQTYGVQKGDYKFHLPSMNLNVNLTDDLVMRLAYGKSIARANLPALRGGVTIETATVNVVNPQAFTGNPNLAPLESNNFDLSLEWYYGDGSYVSVAYFDKAITQFPKTVDSYLNYPGLANPVFGQYADAARATGLQSLDEIFTYVIENFDGQDGVTNNGGGTGQVVGSVNRDPLVDFKYGLTTNGDAKNGVDGIELAVQHMFGESGFGVMANYTFVNSDVGYDPYTLGGSDALLGVSDSANLVGFYDKNGIQVRVAYNWRDRFLDSHNQELGLTEPIFDEAFKTIDLNVSYDITDNAQIFLKGINITGEDNRSHGRGSNLLISHEETGARWMLGGRYQF
ncbi:TonB-dependent receptor [Simiduia agarivorans]|uniref:TonB-dependent receptor, plug n=1 Tax=Simiduia agarivorans (strain DSM 21679 / JCM 13881 / BCRC 17597 / SA1) TaxID=1117647 RepID=K4KQ91_SIMAS|nr:TonB-dependent receptor [Simiduia agarivorans]AFV00441.2 TonB-dependent receptor, plug [Simiduia agarivorans SA1 = DSM 21679]